jgi:uncharacterized protein (TIGR02145 family)
MVLYWRCFSSCSGWCRRLPRSVPSLFLIALTLLAEPAHGQDSCLAGTLPRIQVGYAVRDALVLEWDTFPGAPACQLRVTRPTGDTLERVVFGDPPVRYTRPSVGVPPGVYRWKVRCTCSLSPLLPSPFSLPDTVVVPDGFACDSVLDVDGNRYSGVRIGDQCWMQQNLRTTRYADGTPVPDGTGVGDLSADPLARYRFHYDDQPAYTDTFGLLYTWAAATGDDGSSDAVPSGVQGICPDGWHLPSIAEWDRLADFLGGRAQAGGPLKDTIFWKTPNVAASNITGFHGLPAGDRTDLGAFVNVRENGDFWSATDDGSATNAWIRCLFYERAGLSRAFFVTGKKPAGFSIRCLKD